MNTPRELLLSKHRSAEPKLDAIRREVVNQIASERLAQESPGLGALVKALLVKAWQELFLPCRRVWQGLAVAWCVIVGLQISSSDGSPRTIAKGAKLATPEMRQALRQQQEQLRAELGLTDPVEATRPRDPVVSPRSDRPQAVAVA